jgi:cytochrome c oxidase subunit 2
MNRRRFVHLVVGGAVLSLSAALAAQGGTRAIAIRARKFEFSPREITLRTGQPATLALTSDDFAHGFSIPDLGVRADLVPGRTIEVTIAPTKEGRYSFLCDNFCGEGHDQMGGVLIVTR